MFCCFLFVPSFLYSYSWPLCCFCWKYCGDTFPEEVTEIYPNIYFPIMTIRRIPQNDVPLRPFVFSTFMFLVCDWMFHCNQYLLLCPPSIAYLYWQLAHYTIGLNSYVCWFRKVLKNVGKVIEHWYEYVKCWLIITFFIRRINIACELECYILKTHSQVWENFGNKKPFKND